MAGNKRSGQKYLEKSVNFYAKLSWKQLCNYRFNKTFIINKFSYNNNLGSNNYNNDTNYNYYSNEYKPIFTIFFVKLSMYILFYIIILTWYRYIPSFFSIRTTSFFWQPRAQQFFVLASLFCNTYLQIKIDLMHLQTAGADSTCCFLQVQTGRNTNLGGKFEILALLPYFIFKLRAIHKLLRQT